MTKIIKYPKLLETKLFNEDLIDFLGVIVSLDYAAVLAKCWTLARCQTFV